MWQLSCNQKANQVYPAASSIKLSESKQKLSSNVFGHAQQEKHSDDSVKFIIQSQIEENRKEIRFAGHAD
jgi:hypothetical protein